MITRGFQGKRARSEPKRLPPGQHLTTEFPVLSAGPTPQTPVGDWTFAIEAGDGSATFRLAGTGLVRTDEPRLALKLEGKRLDAIVANDVTRDGAGFDTATNAVTLLSRDRSDQVELPLMSKLEVAHRILDEVLRLRRAPLQPEGA